MSIVTPTLNEEQFIARHIASAAEHQPLEHIISDGGSEDATVRLAQAAGARVISAKRGRGPQLQAGAEAARGDVLLFLHADTILPQAALEHIRTALSDGKQDSGCFRLRFDRSGRLLGLYAWATQFDTRFTTFGDQAMFATRAAFKASGGFPDWPLLEDLALRQRLRGTGCFRKLHAAVTTSARRFEKHGVIQTQLRNASILGLYGLGVHPETLARWYLPHRVCRDKDEPITPW